MCVLASGSAPRPEYGVGDGQADRRVEQDRVSFRPGAEIHHASLTNRPGHAAVNISPFSQVETKTTVSGSGTANGSENMSVLGMVKAAMPRAIG